MCNIYSGIGLTPLPLALFYHIFAEDINNLMKNIARRREASGQMFLWCRGCLLLALLQQAQHLLRELVGLGLQIERPSPALRGTLPPEGEG